MSTVLEQQIKGIVQNLIFENLSQQNLPVTVNLLNTISTTVSEEIAPDLISEVETTSNFQIDSITKNAIGSVNPVDLVSSNLGAVDLTSNLSSIIQSLLSQKYSERIAASVQGQLSLNASNQSLKLINLESLGLNLSAGINTSIDSTINNVLSNFSKNIFSRNQSQQSFLKGVESIFNTQDSSTALEKINESFATSTAGIALTEAQKFNINNESNQEKLIVVEKGFLDPTAKYPTKEYSEITETNKLATGDARGTVVVEKNKNKMKGAKLPYGESWDQPDSPFRGAYPFNKVTQTESGHIIEIDDTPGSERLHVYHRSGTFIEIDANGSVIKRTVGSSYEIIDRNGKIAITGKADISVNGACNIFVGNDANIEVEGDVNLTCHNDITAQAGGTLNLSGREEVNITGGNVNVEAYYTSNIKAGATLSMHSSNVIHMMSNAEIKVQGTNLFTYADNMFNQTLKNHHLKSGGSIFNEAAENINIKSAGKINQDASEEINILSLADVNVDGNRIYWNSDTATGGDSASESQISSIAGSSKIGVLSGRKDIFSNSVEDPQALTLADNTSLLLEEETQTEADFREQKNIIITQGYANSNDISAEPVIVEQESVTSVQSLLIAPSTDLLKATSLPGNYNLSPNFTLEMLTDKAAVTRDRLRAHGDYTYGDLVYNLQALALNVLEPIKKIYPNMFVTSAFRDPGNTSNSKTSQHPQGRAADIQFKGVTKKEYYEIALKIAKVIKYDQFILEYCNYTKNPWLHVSFNYEKNRTQVLTFFNHRKHSDGLTQIG